MNSVAGQMVATTMNSSFTARQNISLSQDTSSQDFSKVLAKANNNHETQSVKSSKSENNHEALESVAKDKPEALTQEKSNQEITKTNDAKTKVENTEVDKTALEDKVNEVIKEAVNEVTNLTFKQMDEEPVVIDEETAMVEEAIEAMSQMLGITPEALIRVMEDLELSFESLSEGDGLITLIQEVKELDGQAAVLLNEEATEAFKNINNEIKTLIENFEGNVKDLEQKFSEVSEQMVTMKEVPVMVEGEVVVQNLQSPEETKVQTTEAPTGQLEVVDLRESSQTTKNEQQNGQSKGQDQNLNNPSFGELMAQHQMDNKGAVADVKAVETTYVELHDKGIIDQIVTKAIVQLTDDKTTMELQLSPGNLGKVAISITAEQGMVKGQFVVENQAVKEMLETNLIQLKAQLEEQGIKVDKIEVALGNANQYFEQREQQQQHSNQKGKSNRSSRRISRLMEVDALETLEQAEQAMVPDHLKDLDAYTVEYSA